MVVYYGFNNSNDSDALNDLSCHDNRLMVVYDGFNSKDSDALNGMTTDLWWYMMVLTTLDDSDSFCHDTHDNPI